MAGEEFAPSSLVAAMNDRLRTNEQAGFIILTNGVKVLDEETVGRIVKAVREFTGFNPDNNPHGEHDFGMVYVGEHIILWKIDYYDPTLTCGSEDPTNEGHTCRVLTIMLREEY